MMNVIAISLVVASMAFAGVWSPNPAGGGGGDQVIVKEGHRAVVVVVEYADDSGHGNTKVSISPPLTEPHKGSGDSLSSAKDAVAGVAQDAKEAAMGAVGPDDEAAGRGAEEWICDAFGNCKHKISGAIYKAKHKVSETAEEVEEGAKEAAGSVIDSAKEAASKAKHGAAEGTGKAKRSASRAKEAVEDTAEELKHKGKATVGKAGEAVGDAADKAKRTASRAGEKVKETAEKAKEEISDIVKSGKAVLHRVTAWLIPRGVFSSLMSVVHLLGFAMAYGTETWVMFAMSHLLARSLPRQQFGVVQSRVYPIYLKAMAASVGLALIGHLFGHRHPGVSNVARTLQSYNLAGLIAMVLANLFYLEPRATKVMYERMKLEKEEGRGVSVQTTKSADTPLSSATTTITTTQRREGGEAKLKMERLTSRLRNLNSYSSLLNVVTLMGLTWHLVYLSQRLCV